MLDGKGRPALRRQCGLANVVERTFGLFGRCRRLAKDWETSIASSTAWVNIASIREMIRRLAAYGYVG